MGNYHQLSAEERLLIYQMHASGISNRKIAKQILRSHTTVARELERNKSPEVGYLPDAAHNLAQARRVGKRLWKLAADTALRTHVLRKLQIGWSPEQIAGRLRKLEGRTIICYETIYRYIYSPTNAERQLYKLLPAAKKKRALRGSKRATGSMPAFVSIHARPEEINQRETFGHWEGDLLCFRKQYNENISTLVERKSRYSMLIFNPYRFTSTVMKKMLKRYQSLPNSAAKSITFDQGKEFCQHTRLHKKQMQTYFCDAGKPWQKGAVENINRRIRRFLPKKTNPKTLCQKTVGQIMKKLNTTPRKCLGFSTPYEIFADKLKKSGALQC